MNSLTHARLGLETLEARNLMATAIINGDGNLVITGDSANESFTVNTTDPKATTVTVNGRNLGTFDASGGTRVIVSTGDGTNVVQIVGNMDSEVHGGAGTDYLYGGSGTDVLFGHGGNDYLSGGGGNNALVGGLGADHLSGGSGKNIVVGGETSLGYDEVRAALDEWVATVSETGPAVQALYASVTDPSDAANKDIVTGGAGPNLYIVRANGATPDYVSDYNPGRGDKILFVA